MYYKPSSASLLPDNWLELTPYDIALLAPIQKVEHPLLDEKGVHLYLKREDLLDEYLGGNKVYKLLGHLRRWRETGQASPILSFGGAYSNHLYALAAASQRAGIPCIGVVRGDAQEALSPTLVDAQGMGMKLHFLSRSDYRNKHTVAVLEALEAELGEFYLVPEGGGGVIGAEGCVPCIDALRTLLDRSIDVVCHACGTGASLAGIAAGADDETHVLGFSVLKGYPSLADEIQSMVEALQGSNTNWQLNSDYHCGGYAKFPSYLNQFMADFYLQTQIMLDPVYTGKMVWAIFDLIGKGFWAENTTIMAIHSGGIQGRRGYSMM